MFSAKIRSSIQMSDQADGRFVFISRGCRNRPVYITVFIHSDIFHSKFFISSARISARSNWRLVLGVVLLFSSLVVWIFT